jgi:hypothetical protein
MTWTAIDAIRTPLAPREASPPSDLSLQEYRAYLLGALHDGTKSHLHGTHRISQKGTEWLERLRAMLAVMGHRSWLYREGKDRDVHVLETSASFLEIDFDPDLLATTAERIAYVRGYFDAEGGLPRSAEARFYVQFTQKDRDELEKVKAILVSLGIACGKLHNPSSAVDPDYWRFYVRARSYQTFAAVVGSWHPRKETLLHRAPLKRADCEELQSARDRGT